LPDLGIRTPGLRRHVRHDRYGIERYHVDSIDGRSTGPRHRRVAGGRRDAVNSGPNAPPTNAITAQTGTDRSLKLTQGIGALG